jgi:hypothetical protein
MVETAEPSPPLKTIGDLAHKILEQTAHRRLNEGEFNAVGMLSASAIIQDDQGAMGTIIDDINRHSHRMGTTQEARLRGILDVVSYAAQFGAKPISDDDYDAIADLPTERDYKKGVEIPNNLWDLERRGLVELHRFGDITSIRITPKGSLAKLRFATKNSDHPITW